MTRRGHLPRRTCAGCRARVPKMELVRVVRAATGVEVDRSGRAPGRGAYVHPRRDCIDAAIRSGGIARALRIGVRGEAAGRLRERLEQVQERM